MFYSNKDAKGFASHCLDQDLKFHINDFKILHTGKKRAKLNLYEQLEIYKAIKDNKNITNDERFWKFPTFQYLIKP